MCKLKNIFFLDLSKDEISVDVSPEYSTAHGRYQQVHKPGSFYSERYARHRCKARLFHPSHTDLRVSEAQSVLDIQPTRPVNDCWRKAANRYSAPARKHRGEDQRREASPARKCVRTTRTTSRARIVAPPLYASLPERSPDALRITAPPVSGGAVFG